MEALRDDRLKEKKKEDDSREMEKEGESGKGKGKGKGWGGDDETVSLSAEISHGRGLMDDLKPSSAISTLMLHTAASFSSSPNPRLLEMRIMTHHANDERFDFLRGRYKTTWMKVKEEVRRGKARPKEEKAMGALVGGYESGDEDVEEHGTPPRCSPPKEEILPPSPWSMEDGIVAGTQLSELPAQSKIEQEEAEIVTNEEEEREEKILRLRRLVEWKRKRGEAKDIGGSTT